MFSYDSCQARGRGSLDASGKTHSAITSFLEAVAAWLCFGDVSLVLAQKAERPFFWRGLPYYWLYQKVLICLNQGDSCWIWLSSKLFREKASFDSVGVGVVELQNVALRSVNKHWGPKLKLLQGKRGWWWDWVLHSSTDRPDRAPLDPWLFGLKGLYNQPTRMVKPKQQAIGKDSIDSFRQRKVQLLTPVSSDLSRPLNRLVETVKIWLPSFSCALRPWRPFWLGISD